MFLKLRSHIIDVDIIRHIDLRPPVLIVDIGSQEDIQIDFETVDEAKIAFDGLTKLLQAQAVEIPDR